MKKTKIKLVKVEETIGPKGIKGPLKANFAWFCG